MKKLFALLFITSLGSEIVQAQSSSESEMGFLRLEATAGIYTTKDIFTDIEYPTSGVWGKNATGTYFLGISFFRYKKLEVGVSAGYQKAYISNPVYSFDYNTGINIEDNLDVTYLTFIPNVRLNWVSSEDNKFEMYSSFGLGLTNVREDYEVQTFRDDSYLIPAFDITGFGIRLGNKFGGFMEVGFGTKGLMRAGLSLRL
ncbi:hypothetical protein [Owenweeksia hongkongensis]|uniref:hypothetical protein n=1 Tax=Owenweeksia hongkongensis TaxID=253245 RepID=UPI003A8E730F